MSMNFNHMNILKMNDMNTMIINNKNIAYEVFMIDLYFCPATILHLFL